jgi:hypothetical protein
MAQQKKDQPAPVTWQPSRRDVLRLGGLGGLGLTWPQLLQARDQAVGSKAATFGRAKRVIMLFLHGGHPQQETFDPKPTGPTEVRGEFGAISTRIPGIQFSELLPQCAQIADQLAVVRSMSHDNANHVQACLPAQTGHKHPKLFSSRGDFPPSETDFPPFGAVLDHVRPAGSDLPTWVRVGPLMRRSNGTTLHGQTPGFLGKQHSSFAVDQALLPADVKIKALDSQPDLTTVRLTDRQQLRQQFNQLSQQLDRVANEQSLNGYYARAVNLLASAKTRQAFDLAQEPEKLRERYGKTEFGQRCLLARRLAEAGVPLVNVSYCHTPSGSWDTHGQNFKKMKDSLGPDLDTALTALVGDLKERGMLSDTLVVVNAEFGRTPAINKNAGRDHWPWVYSLVLAGAGVNAGTVYGASDKSAAYPASKPHDPADMAATIYHLLGVSPDTRIYDSLRRPHTLVTGLPIEPLLA